MAVRMEGWQSRQCVAEHVSSNAISPHCGLDRVADFTAHAGQNGHVECGQTFPLIMAAQNGHVERDKQQLEVSPRVLTVTLHAIHS